MNLELVIRSVLLGAGLAMDAFSVSLADGLADQNMKGRRMAFIAGTFAAFQFAMPMIGWVLVRTAVEKFSILEKFIPWIALLLLLYIGGKMMIEGIAERREGKSGKNDNSDGSETLAAEGSGVKAAGDEDAGAALPVWELFVQGVATSIDALSVGFTIESYGLYTAMISSLIIGAVTFGICMAGLSLGKKMGTILSGRASILGGIILIAIGLEIWIEGLFF